MLSSCLPPNWFKEFSMAYLLRWVSYLQIGLTPRITSPVTSHSAATKFKRLPTSSTGCSVFSVFMAIIQCSQPKSPPDLLGYQNLIVQTSQICQEGHWVLYDRCFRPKASALGFHQWSTIDMIVWNLTFLETSPKSPSITHVPQHATHRLQEDSQLQIVPSALIEMISLIFSAHTVSASLNTSAIDVLTTTAL